MNDSVFTIYHEQFFSTWGYNSTSFYTDGSVCCYDAGSDSSTHHESVAEFLKAANTNGPIFLGSVPKKHHTDLRRLAGIPEVTLDRVREVCRKTPSRRIASIVAVRRAYWLSLRVARDLVYQVWPRGKDFNG